MNGNRTSDALHKCQRLFPPRHRKVNDARKKTTFLVCHKLRISADDMTDANRITMWLNHAFSSGESGLYFVHWHRVLDSSTLSSVLDSVPSVPSDSFRFFQVPSGSFRFLQVSSCSFRFLHVPSRSFMFLQVPSVQFTLSFLAASLVLYLGEHHEAHHTAITKLSQHPQWMILMGKLNKYPSLGETATALQLPISQKNYVS